MDTQPAQALDLGDGAEKRDRIAHAAPARVDGLGLRQIKAICRELGGRRGSA
jgi:hypothetical protein